MITEKRALKGQCKLSDLDARVIVSHFNWISFSYYKAEYGDPLHISFNSSWRVMVVVVFFSFL